MTTACGEPVPPQACQEIERLAERLGLVMRQIEAIEAERDAAVHRAAAGAGSGARAAASIAALARLKGIGANDATLLTHEVFYREFRNRRELAGWAGLTPTPWASGDVQRDQGIGRDGPGWIRAQLVQMAWRWVRFQPDSALSLMASRSAAATIRSASARARSRTRSPRRSNIPARPGFRSAGTRPGRAGGQVPTRRRVRLFPCRVASHPERRPSNSPRSGPRVRACSRHACSREPCPRVFPVGRIASVYGPEDSGGRGRRDASEWGARSGGGLPATMARPAYRFTELAFPMAPPSP